MEADRVDELIGGYVLDALSEEDERELEEHLRRSPQTRERLAALQETAGTLAFGVDAPTPPPALRERLLVASREAERPPANVVPLRRRWVTPALGAAAAAAAAVAIGLGIWGASVSSSREDARQALDRQSAAIALIAGRDSQRFDVSGTNGTLVVAPSGEAALVLPGLGPAPSGKTYEAWVIDDGQAAPAGLFEGGSDSVVSLTRPVPEGATVAITVENDGGVEAPTSEPIAFAPSA